MKESCNCEVGRDSNVDIGAGQSGPGQCGERCNSNARAVEKQAMNESEAPSNRQAGTRVFNRPGLLARKEAVCRCPSLCLCCMLTVTPSLLLSAPG